MGSAGRIVKSRTRVSFPRNISRIFALLARKSDKCLQWKWNFSSVNSTQTSQLITNKLSLPRVEIPLQRPKGDSTEKEFFHLKMWIPLCSPAEFQYLDLSTAYEQNWSGTITVHDVQYCHASCTRTCSFKVEISPCWSDNFDIKRCDAMIAVCYVTTSNGSAQWRQWKSIRSPHATELRQKLIWTLVGV